MTEMFEQSVQASQHAALTQPTTIELLLTARQPISHHDPDAHDDSNINLFNRQKQLYGRSAAPVKLTQEEIDAACAREPVPGDIAGIVQDMSFFDFVACAVVRRFLDTYNFGDGFGIFTGIERYSRLENRVKTAAVRTRTLRDFWNRLTTDLQVGVHGGDDDMDLYLLLSIARSAQEAVLRKLSTETRSVIAVARLWHRTKAENKRAGIKDQAVILAWRIEDCAVSNAVVEAIEVPAVQGNSLRHQVVRGPLANHLWRMLGIEDKQIPGLGALPPGVEALFVNGGNIASGAKVSGNTHSHAQLIRKNYPSTDLLGGCCDAFDLGESRLAVSGWLVCEENVRALPKWARNLGAAQVSAFDMLTTVTQTRQATDDGIGQMIFSCEALAPETQFVVRLTMKAFTPALTQGALMAAINEFALHPIIGGQQRAGFGLCSVQLVTGDGDLQSLTDNPEAPQNALADEYEAYLLENRERLVAGLCDGTMGTGTRVLS